MLCIKPGVRAKQFEFYNDLSCVRTSLQVERPPITRDIDTPISFVRTNQRMVMKNRMIGVSGKKLESNHKGRTNTLIRLMILFKKYSIVPDVHSGNVLSDR